MPRFTSLVISIQPLMLLHDAMDGREAEPGAFADFLGREERLEDVRQPFRRNAAAGVAHRAGRPPGRVAPRDARRACSSEISTSCVVEGQHAAARHGVAGIDGEIGDDLLDHRGVGFDGGQVGRELAVAA